jgi:hypothetical protein
LKTETKGIKEKIKLVKAQGLARKDIVLRIEVIKHCITQKRDAGMITGRHSYCFLPITILTLLFF